MHWDWSTAYSKMPISTYLLASTTCIMTSTCNKRSQSNSKCSQGAGRSGPDTPCVTTLWDERSCLRADSIFRSAFDFRKKRQGFTFCSLLTDIARPERPRCFLSQSNACFPPPRSMVADRGFSIINRHTPSADLAKIKPVPRNRALF